VTFHVPDRFAKAVILHIVKNLSGDPAVPLILGIHGPSGVGKTFQCEEVLRQLGVERFLISGGQLESGEAGEPAMLVRRRYLQAGEFVRSRGRAATLVINDIDTGLGNWGERVQYTVNRQTVFGELMHLVDYPRRVEGIETARIPIIVTGNNFASLYQPLVRAGRMSCFEWEPSVEESSKIVRQIFPRLSEKEVAQLIGRLDDLAKKERLPTATIAFFSHLRSTMNDDALWDFTLRQGPSQTVQALIRGASIAMDWKWDFGELLQRACELMSTGKLRAHIEHASG
jgi:SpoVK/Ycf46/Vps4 family AAA+-type ATPase